MLCALIMAGGRGTRFWPASTENKPKQFLKLLSDQTMLQMTVNRILPLIPIERIFICTGNSYVNHVVKQIPQLPKDNIIIESVGRNTAPCILLSCLHIGLRIKNAEVVVLPSDHCINKEKDFLEVLRIGYEFIKENTNSILTLGICATRPDIGYGYIRYDIEKEIADNIFKVEKFVEKPDLEKAVEYISCGNYRWNAGMFLFDVENMIDRFSRLAPDIYSILVPLFHRKKSYEFEELEKVYTSCPSISIDYAIIEKSNDVYMIPADIDWDDVGSWKALERYQQNDNTNKYSYNSGNNFVFSDKNIVILSNINDICVVDTNDCLIITRKEDMDNIHLLKGKTYE